MAQTWTPVTLTNDTGQKLNATYFNRIETGVDTIDARAAALELGVLTPVTVIYASSVTINATQGGLFRCVATGDLVLTDITGGTNGQLIAFEVQASGANRTFTIGGVTSTITSGQWWTGWFRYNSGTDTWLMSTDGGSSYSDEQVRDVMGTALVAGANITITPNDVSDTITIAAATGGSSYTDEQAQDAAAAMITSATHSGISFSYNDGAGTLAASVAGGGADAATPYGRVFLDDFAGADDDAKLTAALSATAADTYPRTITLRARQYDFATGNRTAFTGMRIEGPPGYGNPERLSATKMPGRVRLTMSGPWFHNGGSTVFSVSFHQLSFTGGSSALVLGMSGSGSWYCLSMRDIFATGLSSLLGSQATPLLITAANFTGDWEINNSYHGAIHIGGSDNTLWTDGMLLDSDPAFNTAGSSNGQYHLWCDSLENTVIGPIYVTCEGPWNGIRVTGSAFNSGSSNAGGPLIMTGMKVEGRNAGQPCNGALIRVEGGIVTLRDCGLSFGMSSPTTPGHSPADAGIVHHSGGQLNVDGCTYDRATGVAESVPFVYTNTTADCIVTKIFRASRGGTWTGKPRFAKPTANPDNRLISDATTTPLLV